MIHYTSFDALECSMLDLASNGGSDCASDFQLLESAINAEQFVFSSSGDFLYNSRRKDVFQNKDCEHVKVDLSVVPTNSGINVDKGAFTYSSYGDTFHNVGNGVSKYGYPCFADSYAFCFGYDGSPMSGFYLTRRDDPTYSPGYIRASLWSNKPGIAIVVSRGQEWYMQGSQLKLRDLYWLSFSGVYQFTGKSPLMTYSVSSFASGEIDVYHDVPFGANRAKTHYLRYYPETQNWQPAAAGKGKITFKVPVPISWDKVEAENVAKAVYQQWRALINMREPYPTSIPSSYIELKSPSDWKTTKIVHSLKVTPTKFDISKPLVKLNEASAAISKRRLDFASFTDIDEVSYEALKQYEVYTSNLLAYVRDLQKAGETIKLCISALRSRGITSGKQFADLWLSTRYGDRLTVADTIDLVQAIDTETRKVYMAPSAMRASDYISPIWQIGRSRRAHSYPDDQILGSALSLCTDVVCAKIWSYPKDLGKIGDTIRHLLEWNLYPTAENTWDLIPLSFVVDWFIDVQSLAEQIDVLTHSLYMTVYTAVYSCKRSFGVKTAFLNDWNEELAVYGCSITAATMTTYSRYQSAKIPNHKWFVGSGSLSSINIIDAGSLLLQLSK